MAKFLEGPLRIEINKVRARAKITLSTTYLLSVQKKLHKQNAKCPGVKSSSPVMVKDFKPDFSLCRSCFPPRSAVGYYRRGPESDAVILSLASVKAEAISASSDPLESQSWKSLQELLVNAPASWSNRPATAMFYKLLEEEAARRANRDGGADASLHALKTATLAVALEASRALGTSGIDTRSLYSGLSTAANLVYPWREAKLSGKKSALALMKKRYLTAAGSGFELAMLPESSDVPQKDMNLQAWFKAIILEERKNLFLTLESHWNKELERVSALPEASEMVSVLIVNRYPISPWGVDRSSAALDFVVSMPGLKKDRFVVGQTSKLGLRVLEKLLSSGQINLSSVHVHDEGPLTPSQEETLMVLLSDGTLPPKDALQTALAL